MTENVQLALIVATPPTLAAVASIIVSLRNGRKTDAVARQVTTGNAQTLAELADQAETRRIDLVPMRQRTTADKDHMKALKSNKPKSNV